MWLEITTRVTHDDGTTADLPDGSGIFTATRRAKLTAAEADELAAALPGRLEAAIAAICAPPQDAAQTSDGFHTFAELYEHRHALFIALARSHGDLAWRSREHEDGTMFGGMFIAGIRFPSPSGDISYHLPISLWSELGCAEILDRAPKWDGHTPADVVNRLHDFRPPLRVVPITAETFPSSPTPSGIRIGWYGEDAQWAVAFGHLYQVPFAEAVDKYQETHDADPTTVEHLWAVMEVDDSLDEDDDLHTIIRWTDVTEDTEHAFPVTVLDTQV